MEEKSQSTFPTAPMPAAVTPKPPLRAVSAAEQPSMLATLADQLDKARAIDRAIREKLQAEKMALMQEHDRKWTETQHAYARKIHEATMSLEAERDLKLRDLQDTYFEKKRELERIELRLDN